MNTTTKTLWKIDPTHSEVQFKVKHLVISTVTGSFGSFDGQIEADATTLKMPKQASLQILTAFQRTMKIGINT